MSIRYTASLEGITAEHLRGGFFEGWSRPLTPEQHLRTLQGCSGCVLAIDKDSGAVVGYITMLTDGVLSAFIPNIEVLPAYRGAGVGSELFRRMLDQLAAIPNVDLMCDESVKPFYARFGMVPLGGMAFRRTEIDLP
ncbi:MAG: GNAT family N-acetyltransferase [Chloroflexi bacterium]|nr:GNAT family N-acetyltransferase [Chloroflexota bacterium]